MMLLLWMKPLVHGTMTLLLDLHCNVHDAPDVEDLYSRNVELLGERLQSWHSAAEHMHESSICSYSQILHCWAKGSGSGLLLLLNRLR